MRRVDITGMGVVSPIGNTLETFWRSIQAGESGAGPITRFDPTGFVTTYAAEVKDFDPKVRIDRQAARKMDRFSQFSVYAALEAWEKAGLHNASVDPDRVGIVLGNGIGGFETTEESMHYLFEKGPERVPPMTIPKLITNIGPANIAITLGVHGPVYTVATACASGTDAIGMAMQHIRAGLCDVIVTGGVEASITKLGVAGFNVIQARSSGFAHDPKRASRPFDKDRDGFVLAEGAGILILESLEHAQARGATIWAEVAGAGMTCDANHLTAPHPEGVGAAKAMSMAIRDAGLQPEDIDYVNAHGTSTPINDPTETKAIKLALGEHAYKTAVSSTKSMTGHCVGAAGGVEAIVCAMAVHDNFLPATINLDEPDPACDLDYVPNKGRKSRVRAAMSNSLGFGGHNGVVVLKKFA